MEPWSYAQLMVIYQQEMKEIMKRLERERGINEERREKRRQFLRSSIRAFGQLLMIVGSHIQSLGKRMASVGQEELLCALECQEA